MNRGLAWMGLIVVGACAGPRPLAGQLGSHGAERIVARPRSTVVAMTVRLPNGSMHDEPGLEGTANLVARVLEERLSRDFPGGRAGISVEVDRSSVRYTVLTPAEAWRATLDRLDAAIFDAELDADLFAETRASTLESLAFESGSPIREYREEAVRVLAPPDAAWARPLAGDPTSVDALTLEALERYRSAYYRREHAALVVVGDVEPPAPAPSDTTGAAPPDPAPPDAVARPGLAWETGERIDVVRDVTSAWLTIAYPAPRTARRIEIELLAHVLEEELDPTPPDPDRFSVEIRVEDPPGGSVVVVEAAVLPDAADRWEQRIRSAVARLADQPLTDDFFRLRLRRFRAARLLAEGAPEALAARIAEDLHREGRARDLAAEIRSLSGTSLSEVAKSLGEPHVFRFGPDLGEDAGGRAPDAAQGRAAPRGPAYIPGSPGG